MGERFRALARKWGRRIWAWLRIGWGLITSVGLALQALPKLLPALWRRIADLDTLHSLWTWGGADLPTLISLVASPFFGLAMILIGFVGIPEAIRVAEGERVHRISLVLGWAVFIMCASLLLGALEFGGYANSSGVLEAERFYIEQHTERHLTDPEVKSIVDAFSPIKDQIPELRIGAIDTSEATGYAVDFISAFRKVGFTVNGRKSDDPTPPFPEFGHLTSPKMRGVFIGVKAGEPVSDKAKLFSEKLTKAGFHPQFIGWDGMDTDHFMFVVGNR